MGLHRKASLDSGVHASGYRTGFRRQRKISKPMAVAESHKSRVGKFSVLDPQLPQRHHDAIEFPDGSRVLVTQLVPGQRMTVLQLPVTSRNSKPAPQERGAVGIPENPPLPA